MSVNEAVGLELPCFISLSLVPTSARSAGRFFFTGGLHDPQT